jgi:hypothetical protein
VTAARRLVLLVTAVAAATPLALPATTCAAAPADPRAAPGMQTGLPGLAPAAPDLGVRPPEGHVPGAETRCGFCHTAEGWKKVSFSHDKTGFPLTGRHRDVTCSACHPGGDFGKPVARACAACHRDVHAQRLGQRCDRCHDTGSWKEASFGPDAHRRTAFPLTGRHAALPCESCHGDRRDRAFSRPVVACVGCHQQDYDRTIGGGGGALDHAASGFSTDCRSCHGTSSFPRASFPAHDACFAIRAGPHAGIACTRCHTSIPPIDPQAGLQCNSGTFDCLRCHGGVDVEHAGVPGYLRANQRCYECHRFASPLPRLNGGHR